MPTKTFSERISSEKLKLKLSTKGYEQILKRKKNTRLTETEKENMPRENEKEE